MGGFTPGARRKAFASKSRRRRSDWDRSAQHCGAPDAPLARVHLSFLQGQLTHGFTPHQQPISQLILNKLFTIDLKRLTFPLFDTLATLSPSRAAFSGSGLGLTQWPSRPDFPLPPTRTGAGRSPRARPNGVELASGALWLRRNIRGTPAGVGEGEPPLLSAPLTTPCSSRSKTVRSARPGASAPAPRGNALRVSARCVRRRRAIPLSSAIQTRLSADSWASVRVRVRASAERARSVHSRRIGNGKKVP